MKNTEENLANEKKVSVTAVNIKFPDTLIDKIDKYQTENHLNSRTSAVLELIRIGLGELERK